MSQHPKALRKNNGLDFTPTIHNDTYDYIKPEQFEHQLHDRAVLITGASKGLGRHAALSFAKAGASQIAIAARTGMEDLETELTASAKKAGRAPPQVLRLSLDVTSEQSVEAAAKEVERVFGRLDILLNNAGYLGGYVPITASKVDEWWKVWEVNVKGIYLVTRAFLPLMFKSKDSLTTVLNVTSIGAHLVAPGGSGYQTAKLAVLRFGEFLNKDYADQGLISFGVHPGGVMTDLAKGLPQATHALLVDQPALAADTIVWLTAQRREWLRGRYVSSTWDMKELLEMRPRIESEDLLKVRMDVGLE